MVELWIAAAAAAQQGSNSAAATAEEKQRRSGSSRCSGSALEEEDDGAQLEQVQRWVSRARRGVGKAAAGGKQGPGKAVTVMGGRKGGGARVRKERCDAIMQKKQNDGTDDGANDRNARVLCQSTMSESVGGDVLRLCESRISEASSIISRSSGAAPGWTKSSTDEALLRRALRRTRSAVPASLRLPLQQRPA